MACTKSWYKYLMLILEKGVILCYLKWLITDVGAVKQHDTALLRQRYFEAVANKEALSN